jgi:restriction modification system DNA specificity domain protein
MIVLDDLCLNIVDCLHKTAPINELGNYFAVGTPAMRGNSIDYSLARRIDDITFYEWTKRLRPRYGDLLLAREAPVGPVVRIPIEENVAPGQRTVLLRPDTAKVISDYLYYLLIAPEQQERLNQPVGGSTVAHLNVADVRSFRLPEVPSLMEQRRIAGVLGALDDKIESNLRVRNLCRDLGGNLVADTVRSAPNTQLEHYAASISRGVTPQYYKDEDTSPVLVLNQKCIRDGWVTPELARLMTPRAREKSQAIARLDDLLVNSTGQGTLGRVARWDSDDPIYVDSHVTVVKADPRRIYPVLMPYLVFPLQDEIEHMATGSTGQTELSPSRLAQLNVPLLSLEEQRPLSARLVALEAQAHYCQVQSLKLTELRDALLPELMSGRMRVDEAGRLVSEALDEEVADV